MLPYQILGEKNRKECLNQSINKRDMAEIAIRYVVREGAIE